MSKKRKVKSSKTKSKNQKRKISPLLYWSPRILSILFILFLGLFSLDIFGNNYTFWETVVGLFMHNIPSIILLVLVLIAWKHELVGAIAFIGAGLFYIFITLKNPIEWYLILSWLTITGPAILVGVLWFINWKKKNAK